MALNQMRSDINTYLEGRKWYWYTALLLVGIYMFIAILKYDPNKQLSLFLLAPQSFDFGLHEFMHILLGFMPPVITAASGSLSEIALGLGLIIGAFKTRCYFAVLFCALWFMLACQSAGIYMADATVERLNLVSLGGVLSGSDKTLHDWKFVFGELNLLDQSKFIGNTVRVVGVIVAVLALGFAMWLIVRMAASKNTVQKDKTKPQPLYPTATKGPLSSAPGSIAKKRTPEDTKSIKGGSNGRRP